MRYALLSLLLLLGVPTTASAQLSIGISIGAYPHFDVVPGYPVYYATDVDQNFFFFDGLYWVYQGDNWYSSSWYDGPWDAVDRNYVPVYLLQVPVRYYHRPPMYFRGWQADRPPRWGDHWGQDWDRRRAGWDRPRPGMAPAPLPDYQREYRGSTYPRGEQQRALRDQNYKYRPQAAADRPARGANARPQRPEAAPAMPARTRPAPDAPTGNRPPAGDARRPEPTQPAQPTERQRPGIQQPQQQPQAQRPTQPMQQRAAPQPARQQPPARQDEGGRDNRGGRRNDGGRPNGKAGQDDNRAPDKERHPGN